MSLKFHGATFDCADPKKLSEFWSKVTERPIGNDYGKVITIEPANGEPLLVFMQIDNLPTQRNRVHIDFATPDLDAETERLTGLGATVVEKIEMPQLRYTTFADPEGNKFDVEHKPH